MIDEKKLKKELAELSMKCPYSVLDDRFALYTECFEKAMNLVKEQPKVGEWIPVEERTPENLEFVDITFTCETFFGETEYFSSIAQYDGYVWWNTDGDILDEDVIAWKPRSEPYRKEDNK